MNRKAKTGQTPGEVLQFDRADASGGGSPPAPDSNDPFASFWISDLECYVLMLDRAIPELRITLGSFIYAKAIKPEAGDIVVCDTGTTGRCSIGRFVRGDGFRVLLEDSKGQRWIITPKAILVVHGIAEGDA